MRLLSLMLDRVIQKGTLRVIDSEGETHTFAGIEDGPTVTIRLHDAKLAREIALNPELKAGEAYMDGLLTVEEGGDYYDFLYLFSINRNELIGAFGQKLLRSITRALKFIQQKNTVKKAERNARHHYDISRELYQLFLDENMQYSCAYFRDPEQDTLEQAQIAKMRHIAAKLQLEPGMTVADIGSGWGSLACFLAKTENVSVTGINVSPEQIAAARERAEAEGISDRVRFERVDYRQLTGQYDRIVSVGMFEHVGVPNYDAFFTKVFDLLKPDGYAMLHTISKMSPPGATSPFIRKYIFPGGYSPALSEVLASTERSHLWVADVEVLRLHYYHTLRHWRARFTANREEAKALYDERFCRMWEFYLAAAELSFLHGSNMVAQLLLARTRDAVPLVRDFIVDDERTFISRDAAGGSDVVPLRRPVKNG